MPDTAGGRCARPEGDRRQHGCVVRAGGAVACRAQDAVQGDVAALGDQRRNGGHPNGVDGVRTELKSDIAGIKVGLSEKPSRTYMWAILAVLLTAFGRGLASQAILK